MSGEWGGPVEPAAPGATSPAAVGAEPSDPSEPTGRAGTVDGGSAVTDIGPTTADAATATSTGGPEPSRRTGELASVGEPGVTTGSEPPPPGAPQAPSGVEAVPAPGVSEEPASASDPVHSDTFVASPPVPPPPTAPSSPTAAPASLRRRRLRLRRTERPRHRRSRRFGPRTLVIGATVLVLGGSSVAARATVTLPPATLDQTLPSAHQVALSQHPVSWPTGVQAALAIPALGVSERSGPEQSAPIASVTKLMTAHIVLSDHPLTVDQDGPSVTITPEDVNAYLDDENTDQANIEVAAGEVLTERQLLEGMLIHSANNFADLLAEWDAGSVAAFVVKMNAAARSLGMSQTTYSDASGFSTQTVSTPADQLKLASVLVQSPVIDEIVDNTSVTLPVAGTVGSYTPLVGVDGVVGLKSGFTSAAGGCDVLFLSEKVAGLQVEVLAAVTGYQGSGSVIDGAGLEALSVARQALGELQRVQVVAPGERVAVAQAAGAATPVVTQGGISVLAWPGQVVAERLIVVRPPPSGARAGWRVGSVAAQVGLQERTVPIVTTRRLPTPSFFQRVF